MANGQVRQRLSAGNTSLNGVGKGIVTVCLLMSFHGINRLDSTHSMTVKHVQCICKKRKEQLQSADRYTEGNIIIVLQCINPFLQKKKQNKQRHWSRVVGKNRNDHKISTYVNTYGRF